MSSFADLHAFHASLAKHNMTRIAVGVPSIEWEAEEIRNLEFKIQEGRYLEKLRATIMPMTAGYIRTADQFVEWFETLADWGPGQHHPLFDWLAEEATAAQMRWFLTQEVAGEAGFEDLLAYTQVKLPMQAKLECARNFWDEMGHGKQGAMHGLMLDRMVQMLGLRPVIETTVWEALALSNTMLGLATTRRYAYHSLGALGVIELTAPKRVAQISLGMRRLGMDAKMCAYFDLHAALDVSHARCWLREIIRPLVGLNPECAQFMAEGALMRLHCGRQCYDRYSREMVLERDGADTAYQEVQGVSLEDILC